MGRRWIQKEERSKEGNSCTKIKGRGEGIVRKGERGQWENEA